MATAIMKCRVCGKEYEGCRTAKKVDGVFRWKEVACTPECGAIYLDRIRKSRAKTNVAVARDPATQEAFDLFEEEYENEFDSYELDDEFDDSGEPEIEV